jgi:hypothetical protein
MFGFSGFGARAALFIVVVKTPVRRNLIERLAEGAKPRRRYQKAQDAAVLPLVRRLVDR